MTPTDFITAATEVLADCPLNEFFQWSDKPGKKWTTVSPYWKHEEGAKIALEQTRRLLERVVFIQLRNDLSRAAELTSYDRTHPGMKIIAGHDCLFADKVLDPFPIRSNDRKEAFDCLHKTDDGRTVVNPLWREARFEVRLRAQLFPFDEQDLLGARITAEIKDNHAQVSIVIPEHAPGVVHYWEVLREYRG